MGLYDRDYYRQTRGEPVRRPRGLASMRMVSVTTWLIVICVAVFVTDQFLPMRNVATGRVYGADSPHVALNVRTGAYRLIDRVQPLGAGEVEIILHSPRQSAFIPPQAL